MKNQIKSVAKTKMGSFNVVFTIKDNYTVDAQIDINGKDFDIQKINLNYSDRIHITEEIANEFGVKFDPAIRLQCDISNVINKRKRIMENNEAKQYTGSLIDSGYGFKMRDTKQNHILCAKYGFDAIEKVK